MKGLALLIASAFYISMVACSVNTTELGDQVRGLMQDKLDQEPNTKEYKLKVKKVDVIHVSGNSYGGLATVVMDGKEYPVTVNILADGNKIFYKVEDGGFAFLAHHIIEQAGNDSKGDDTSLPEVTTPTEPGQNLGWNQYRINLYSANCIEIMASAAREGYMRRARSHGQDGRDYPEQLALETVKGVCNCITERASKIWPYNQFIVNDQRYVEPLVKESMAGGQCKPGGPLGEAIKNKLTHAQ
jgi:hypothetical protein